jgi:hypothetical protein
VKPAVIRAQLRRVRAAKAKAVDGGAMTR